ncbi:hypothetical protein DFH11DRAFT_1848113 [Phellopilus nigrolimitatus]|nr:hypothetical protein DFH11DRAFT_1848113 [Phellopilus nigrolimitatus]
MDEEVDEVRVALRVLYTVNTSPQYILAKAPENIDLVSADTTSSSNSFPHYGRASLRTCAIAVCRSSPELRPDAIKDFSVYVLDPLEDFISKGRHMSASTPSGGVAVGMGLLSGILSSRTPDTTMVTGTIVGCGRGENALEVVLSLRQVAPPNPPPMLAPTKSSSNRSKRSKQTPNDHYSHQFASFDERLLGMYDQSTDRIQHGYGSDGTSIGGHHDRRHNPAHDTRAHRLPTPYIGPPKRQYNSFTQSEDSESNREVSEGPSESQPATSSWSNRNEKAPEPPSTLGASLATRYDLSTPSSSQQTSDTTQSYTPELTQNAVMLAALSSLSSKPDDARGATYVQEGHGPNPDLVAFLRAYLSALESQQAGEAPGGSTATTQPIEPTITADTDPHIHDTEPKPQIEAPNTVADKENWKPPRPQQHPKEQESVKSTNTSPLGLGRFNSRLSNDLSSSSSTTAMVSKNQVDANAVAAPSTRAGEKSKKRRLSEANRPDERDPQARRIVSSSSKCAVERDDISGTRVNRGWGGLRIRADGSFGGAHPLKPPATDIGTSASANSTNNPRGFFFRSAGSTVTESSTRKGPYIVPEWARGVPPPAPPPRLEGSKDDKEGTGSKRKRPGKSKGLERLGGKSSVKRVVSASDESGVPAMPSQSTSPPRPLDNGSTTPRSPGRSSTRTSPGKPPIFAQSSPLAKTAYANFFQAFQTSPPRSGGDRKGLLSTPRRIISASSPGGSAKHSSLFTPSPIMTNLGTGFKPRSLFTAGDPPSPSPTEKRARPTSGSKSSNSDNALNFPRRAATPFAAGSSSLSHDDDNDPPSCLPIASSDDPVDESVGLPERPISSDSTIMNSSKIHDWSSLDLPPSSPPPQSSPSIVAMDEIDLPCSDIPSSDMSQEETPPAIDRASPDEGIAQVEPEGYLSALSPGIDLNFPNMTDLFTDPTFSNFNPDMSTQTGSAADAAIDALKNGLDQEDLTEAWSLLDNVLNPVVPSNELSFDSQMQEWLAGSSSQNLDFGGVGDTNAVDLGAARPGEIDYASLVATNFEDLLKGCLV